MARKRVVKRNKGASKALSAMIKRYGAKTGRRIFYSKASKYGKKGTRPSQKANAVYGTGSHRVKRSRRKKK